jgi:hypothetical protein
MAQIDNVILEQLLEAANDRVLTNPEWAKGVQHAVSVILRYQRNTHATEGSVNTTNPGGRLKQAIKFSERKEDDNSDNG